MLQFANEICISIPENRFVYYEANSEDPDEI